MDLRVIRYFLAVAEAGSLTQAARRVHVAQPSLTRQLRQMEAELGLSLFNRSRGGLTLTVAGRRFLPMARDLTMRADDLRSRAASLRTGEVQQLEMVAPMVTIADWIAPYLATVPPEHPAIVVVDDAPALVMSALSRGADFVVASTVPTHDVTTVLIAHVPVYAYVRSDHEWAGRQRISLRDLTKETLLLPTAEQWTRTLLDQAVQQLHLAYSRIVEFRVPQVAQAFAAAGRGIAVVSDDPRFGLHPLLVEGSLGLVRLPLYAAWERGHYADTAIRDVVRRMSQYCVLRYGASVLTD